MQSTIEFEMTGRYIAHGNATGCFEIVKFHMHQKNAKQFAVNQEQQCEFWSDPDNYVYAIQQRGDEFHVFKSTAQLTMNDAVKMIENYLNNTNA